MMPLPRTHRSLKRWFVCMVLTLSAVSSIHAQVEMVDYSSEKITIEEMINTIEAQTRYVFAFESNTFDKNETLQLDGTRMSVKGSLVMITEKTGSTFLVRERFIMVRRRKETKHRYRTGDRYTPTPLDEVSRIVRRYEEHTQDESPKTDTVAVTVEPPVFYSDYTPAEDYTLASGALPRYAVKTNLLYGAGMLTPNLAVEIALSKNSTLELSGAYNPWNRKASLKDNDKFLHWTVRAEYRHWFCERYNGHFIGGNAFYSAYNISGHTLPLLFDKEYRYEGYASGVVVTYGYSFILSPKWNLELNAGVGVAYMEYDQFDCKLCSFPLKSESKVYFGPARLGVTLSLQIK